MFDEVTSFDDRVNYFFKLYTRTLFLGMMGKSRPKFSRKGGLKDKTLSLFVTV